MSERLFNAIKPDWWTISRFMVGEVQDLISWSLNVDREKFRETHKKLSWVSSERDAYEFCLYLGYPDHEYFNEIGEDIEAIQREYEQRLEVVSNHMYYGGLTVVERKSRYEWNKIKLIVFGDWALSVGFDLPDEFPRTIQKQEPTPFIKWTTPVSTEEFFRSVFATNKSHSQEPSPISPDKPKPVPIKGNPETMRAWIMYVITEEKRLSLTEELYSGLQTELINRAIGEHGYKDGSAVKSAWGALGLRSAHKTT